MIQNDEVGGGNRLSFLGAVAAAYVSRYEEMSDICFLFPNKRAGTFFLKSLSECLGKRTMLAPEVMGVSEFMQRVTGRDVAPRIDIIFRFYKVYRSLLGRSESLCTEADLLDFDRFAPWAETLASDFSEVDKYDVDASAIFKNVRDYRSISSNFLTEEQCDIIERYFGYRPASDNVERFWNSVGPEEDRSILKQKFVELWKLLPELYVGLLENLEADGLALPGTTFRRAMQLVAENDSSALPWSKVVVVGFNMLSTTEARLFADMRDMRDADGEPYADFFWDAVGPVLDADGDGVRSPAAVTMRRNIRNFPMPGWALPFMSRCRVENMPPVINIAAAPSNVAQVKIASMRVKEWLRDIGPEQIADARAAVVIPDESLLLPLIHSLPPELKTVNLTMGYSMRYTAVASFIYHLRRLQSRLRKSGGELGYYHEDFRLFMSHPLVHVVVGSTVANEIITEVNRLHLRVVTLDWLRARSESLAQMLCPIDRAATPAEAVDYISGVLDMVDSALASDGLRTHVINSKIERMQISLYQQALSRLLVCVETHGVKMRFGSVFYLADRLLAGETVTFEGEPLEGLQVMGMLETRALDFDHLVVLSMNDKVMPRRARTRTFIPDALRRGYGMPVAGQSEELYSYYFYRMLSRAGDVTLVYDARAGEGMRSGGKSRFLLQLSMLYARGSVRERVYSFRLESSVRKTVGVVKTPTVMSRLEDFKKIENGRNLSASALMNYCQCQVKFYYKNVVGVKDEVETPDYIDAIAQGNIVHTALLNLYLPAHLQNKYLKSRVVLDSGVLGEIADDEERISRVVRHAVNSVHFHLPEGKLDRELTGTVAMVAERLEAMVANAVRHDLMSAPIELVGGEIAGRTRWSAGNSPEVNFKYAFDRVDVVDGRLRIVDYKTGGSHVEARSVEDIFNGDYKAKYMLQLMLYAHLLEQHCLAKGVPVGEGIRLLIFDVNHEPGEVACCPTIEKKRVESHRDFSAEFIEGMERMLCDIFDETKPFLPTEDEGQCRYCNLKYLCGRE